MNKGGRTMITHYIILCNSYTLRQRIALDYAIETSAPKEELKQKYLEVQEAIKKIKDICGYAVPISTHMIYTNDRSWKSVIERDLYFENVEVIKNVSEFCKIVVKDKNLVGTDIAKYIISKIECTQLKLQKLVYFCYADYLCYINKKMFKDRIIAYQYGPIIESVLEHYRCYGYKPINEGKSIKVELKDEMPAVSRIRFAENGNEIMQSISETLKKYGELKASELVDLTHRENTPWKITRELFDNKRVEISDETILKYHKNEEI